MGKKLKKLGKILLYGGLSLAAGLTAYVSLPAIYAVPKLGFTWYNFNLHQGLAYAAAAPSGAYLLKEGLKKNKSCNNGLEKIVAGKPAGGVVNRNKYYSNVATS